MTDTIKVVLRSAKCLSSLETSLTFASEVTVYREYGPTISLPAQVFDKGPHNVTDYDCKGSYEENWSLSLALDGIELAPNTKPPQLSISDTAPLTSFTLTVTGKYLYNGETKIKIVTQTY